MRAAFAAIADRVLAVLPLRQASYGFDDDDEEEADAGAGATAGDDSAAAAGAGASAGVDSEVEAALITAKLFRKPYLLSFDDMDMPGALRDFATLEGYMEPTLAVLQVCMRCMEHATATTIICSGGGGISLFSRASQCTPFSGNGVLVYRAPCVCQLHLPPVCRLDQYCTAPRHPQLGLWCTAHLGSLLGACAQPNWWRPGAHHQRSPLLLSQQLRRPVPQRVRLAKLKVA